MAKRAGKPQATDDSGMFSPGPSGAAKPVPPSAPAGAPASKAAGGASAAKPARPPAPRAAGKTRAAAPLTPDDAPPARAPRWSYLDAIGSVLALGDVLGQERAVATLQRALRAERVHHAWIFDGPAGVGKFTTALAFAAVLLDPTSAPSIDGDVAPDADSPVQRLVRAGTHPDLHVVVKELAQFSDDKQVRDAKLITIPKRVVEEHLIIPAGMSAALRPGGAATKVFIIDEAELLDRSPTNAPVQNALLKTLEEPPPGTVIILVTSNAALLLPTIRSRAQRVAFGPLGAAAMEKWVRTRGPELGLPGTGEREGDAEGRSALAWLREFGAGAPGQVLSAHRAGAYALWQRLGPMLEEAWRSGSSPRLASVATEFAEEFSERAVQGNAQASKDAANRAGADWALRVLAHRARRELRTADDVGRQRALRTIDLVREAEALIDANVRAEMAMEIVAAGAGE